jgi:hypothetical protein
MHLPPVADPERPRRGAVVIAVAVASSAAYASTALAIISFAVAWSARGEHFRTLVPPFSIEGSDTVYPGGWISLPSDSGPEMAIAAVLALLAGLATWAVVRLRRHTRSQTHSMRRGLLWGVPLVLIVGPAIFAPLVLLMNSISLD